MSMQRSWMERAEYRARVRGCLLGGALGDALGYPVEFSSLGQIRAQYGERGVVGFPSAPARVTDDTQMTLFTVEGLIRARVRGGSKGVCDPVGVVRLAYLRWLDTQSHSEPPPSDGHVRSGWLRKVPWLYAQRAPGNACLSGLASDVHPGSGEVVKGEAGPVNPGSKGCGTVMRSAPFGLGLDARSAFEVAADCARITHGHPTGYFAAGAFASIVAYLVARESLEGAVLRTLELLRGYRAHEETAVALRKALDLAAQGAPSPEKLETLGEGWVAEEALAMGVYCALVEPGEARKALLLSVNHSGDSDSTGSICGNLIGARDGDVRLPGDWVADVEGRGTISALADDFAVQFGDGTPEGGTWFRRYPGV
ncbi:ADP-ribosylglycohydrolase family protein [Actinomadura hibisca]|uniref:ADP-ribosylglycohydrolase family protein n=1 Tax=Actinomadura hibisca TaxID=68565 RepID=UPI00082A2A74|nr:ADP-ribosylglycohydrolase family protein [Actinomadura hibisca]